MMLKPRGHISLEAKNLASASRHSGLGLKILASNQNLTSCAISLHIYLLIMCYTQAFIIHLCTEHTHLTYLLMHVLELRLWSEL